MKTILLTGGGTAGHVIPHLALIPQLKTQYHLQYIGSLKGIEKDLIATENIPYYPISTGKLRRYFSLENVKDAFRVVKGFQEAFTLLGKLQPDLIFSKGGYIAVPVVMAAYARKIPLVIHESDFTPGLTTKISAPLASQICITFPETAKYLAKYAKRITFTGTPIRDSISKGNKEKAYALCGLNNEKPVLMIMGGSSGAQIINQHIDNIIPDLLKQFQIIHIRGKENMHNLKAYPGYKAFGYVNEPLPHLLSITDLAVSRAGSNSIWEWVSLQIPHLLIPLSLRASRGDQILNAQSFQKQGFSALLPEEDMNPATLLTSIQELYENRQTYQKAMAPFIATTGNEKVLQIIHQTIK